jgi:hypothetical protein
VPRFSVQIDSSSDILPVKIDFQFRKGEEEDEIVRYRDKINIYQIDYHMSKS